MYIYYGNETIIVSFLGSYEILTNFNGDLLNSSSDAYSQQEVIEKTRVRREIFYY
jgi:hypothetical protein